VTEPKSTDRSILGNPIPDPRVRPEDGGDYFAAPLGSATSGLLRFTNGAHRVAIRADLHLRGLYRARFGDRMPVVGVRRGIVAIVYPRFPAGDWLDDRSERLAEVELNAFIPWDVEIRSGASRLVADLRGLRIVSLGLDGGAGRLDVMLPSPSGDVAMAILGGASNVTIRRPEGVAARLRVVGGVTNLRFDDRQIGATGCELDLQSRAYERATNRYDIAVTGGANNVNIAEQRTARGGRSGVSA
jgi:hypothetical protein